MKEVHGYILLDEVSWSADDWDEFNKLQSTYFLDFKEVGLKDGRVMYYLAMREYNLMHDQVIELDDGKTATKFGVLTLFSPRNPEIIGVWNKDGTMLGTSLDSETKEIIGEAKYLFDKDKYSSYLTPKLNLDEDGEEISRIEFYDAYNFGGFSKGGF